MTLQAEEPSGELVLCLDNLTFRWPGQDFDTIDIAHLQLQVGEHLFVRGASGSGKTTLLNLLAGVHKPTTGTVEMLGTNLSSLSASQRDAFRADHIGVVFQQFNLLPYLSVIDNVTLACSFSQRKARRVGSSKAARATAGELLRALNLSEQAHDAPVTKLSVGQQQRVAVARALIGSPEIVIADEPTSALDAANRDRFLDLLFAQATAQGSTLIFVSHDAALADRFDQTLELVAAADSYDLVP